METIHDLVALGLIAASDSDSGLVVVSNGAYHNLYRDNGDGTFACLDCQAREKDLYKMTASALIDEAEQYLKLKVDGVECDDCGEEVLREGTKDRNGDTLCEACANKYTECSSCGDWTLKEKLRTFGEQEYCPACYEDIDHELDCVDCYEGDNDVDAA